MAKAREAASALLMLSALLIAPEAGAQSLTPVFTNSTLAAMTNLTPAAMANPAPTDTLKPAPKPRPARPVAAAPT